MLCIEIYESMWNLEETARITNTLRSVRDDDDDNDDDDNDENDEDNNYSFNVYEGKRKKKR